MNSPLYKPFSRTPMTPRAFVATVIAMVASVVALSGCNTSGCTDNQSALPLAGYYSSATGQAISVADFDIAGVGAPGDSLLYLAGVARSEVYLPFRSDAASTSYLFTYYADATTTVTDRITFTYTSEPYFASEECGAMYYYRITGLTYTRNIIDSIGIVDSLITNANSQRIHIYFRTSQQ